MDLRFPIACARPSASASRILRLRISAIALRTSVVAAARDIILIVFPYQHMSIPERETHSREQREGSAMPPTMPATREAFPQSIAALASGSGISSSLNGSPLPARLLVGWDG